MAGRTYAYLIVWRDSCSYRGWNAPGGHDSVTVITSVGWLIHDRPREVSISTSLSDHGSAMDTLTIPREAIVKMKRLPQYIAKA